jgi:hypothetical protein
MAGRRRRHREGSAVFPAVSAVIARLISPQQLDSVRRYELGVEALCELAGDAARVLENGSGEVPTEFFTRYSGLSMAARGEEVPADLRRFTRPMRASKMLAMCLSRVQEFTRHLAQYHSRAQWQDVLEIVDAWINSWGDDERSRYAQARFSTLTGLVRGHEPWVGYMYSALIKSLSEVQA